MKSEKGVTMVTLIVTIVVMLVIAGVAITTGTETIKESKKIAYIKELEIIQEKVNTIYEKIKLNEENMDYYNSIGKDISYVNINKLNFILDGESEDGYRYFTKEDLKQLDLSDISQDVIINFNTCDVVSVTGIIINNQIYYRLADIPGYRGQKIEYTNKNTLAPTFEVGITKLANSWQVVIKDIVYNSNVASGILSYKLHEDTDWTIVGDKIYFEVSEERRI